MPAFKKQAAAGNQRCYAWGVDGNGFPTGGGFSAPAQGAAGSGAVWIKGVKAAAPTIPTPDTVQSTGDDDLVAEFYFASLSSRGFEITYAIEDLDFLATLLGITLQSWGEARVAIMDIVNPPERNMGFIFQSRAQKQDTGVKGQAAWGGSIVPLATYTPLGRGAFEERGAAVYRGYVLPQVAGYDPFGVTIQSSVYGTSGGRLQPFTAENPLTLHRHTGTGAIATFNLDRQPISAAKTATRVNRVAATVTGVTTTAPYDFTVSGNPAGASAVVTVYEHQAVE